MGRGGGWQEPGSLNFFRWSPEHHHFVARSPSIIYSKAWSHQNVSAEPAVAPNIKIRTFFLTDSVITCFVCCLLRIGTKILKNQKLFSRQRKNERATFQPFGSFTSWYERNRDYFMESGRVRDFHTVGEVSEISLVRFQILHQLV